MDKESSVDRDRLASLMKNGWSWSGCDGHSDDQLTEADKQKLANQILKSLKPEIVNGVLKLGMTGVPE